MAFWNKKLGIDLGTANTLVYVPGQGIALNEPSVVAFSPGENNVLAVGLEAKEMVGRTPDEIQAYRPMKDGVIADYRVTEAMLRYYIKKAVGKYSFFQPDVLVSVPAGVSSTERRAVVEAGVKAGAGNAFVVKEPILSAIGAGVPIQEAKGSMVVDIGGGTTDVAVISLGGIVASKSVKCAGNKMDRAIAETIKRTAGLQVGERTAEEAKIAVGSALSVKKDEHFEIKGQDSISGLPRTVEVSANEIEKSIKPQLREITNTIKDVFRETPPELSADIVEQGIIMTGGTSQLANFPELVRRDTGVPARLSEDAFFCVAKGTGEALDHLEVYKKSIIAKR